MIAGIKQLDFGLSSDYTLEPIKSELREKLGENFVDELFGQKTKYHLFESVVLNDEELKQSGIYELNIGQHYERSENGVTCCLPKGSKEFESNRAHPCKKECKSENATSITEGKVPLGKLLLNHIIETTQSNKGSNNWVIHGNLTADGKPILANGKFFN